VPPLGVDIVIGTARQVGVNPSVIEFDICIQTRKYCDARETKDVSGHVI
jgi:hypothetical protein